ncbi:NAD-dependent epimerase/dehydratase family protein [Rhodopirellula sp. JC639]|uniref:NAD-dependent epimerase/dehydratase family protein n=1 Tax=Stieleria mannarensis TaxID=2755585 RepID=UPI00160215EA|nr:NAD(P)-dependent oxidoreductase [Rhodopirellula sp. JC639]
MRIAITGGTGFLGRHLISRLIDQGHEVTAWYRSPSATIAESSDVHWVEGELGNLMQAEHLVAGADAVIHAGLFRGGASFMDSGDDPLKYWHRNATGSLQLLDAAQRAGVKKFIFISSGTVHDTVLPDRPLDETHPLLPSTLYGACKASIETVVHHYGVSGKLVAANLRPPSIYGVARPVNQSRWYDLVAAICAGKAVDARGGGKAVHADDVAKAALLLLGQDDSIAGETYNCCDRMISDFEVAEIAKRITDSPSEITGPAKTAKNEIVTDKIQTLGMRFGGTELLEQAIAELVSAIRQDTSGLV